MSKPSVFISYSHKDEEWKDKLVTHLGVLKEQGLLDIWEDRRIEGGDDWLPEIEKAINRTHISCCVRSWPPLAGLSASGGCDLTPAFFLST
jgi:hypothetical protein